MSVFGLAQNWWLLILRGLGAVGFGLAILLWPNPLVLLFGVYLLTNGILAVIAGLTRHQGARPWWLLLIEGLLAISAGVLTFLMPNLITPAWLYLIAAWALTTGMVEIVAAIRLRKDIENEGLLALSGILSAGFGVVLVIWPGANALALGWLVGSYTLTSGLLRMGLGLRLWNWRWSTPRLTLQPIPVEIRRPVYKPQKK